MELRTRHFERGVIGPNPALIAAAMSRDEPSTKERRSPKIAPIAPLEDAQITLEDDEIKGRVKMLLVGSASKAGALGTVVQSSILEAFWAIGCEPEVEAMHKILNAPNVDTAVFLFTKELVKSGVDVNALQKKVAYFFKMKRLPMSPQGPPLPPP